MATRYLCPRAGFYARDDSEFRQFEAGAFALVAERHAVYGDQSHGLPKTPVKPTKGTADDRYIPG
jgi:hypothetical protein